MPPNNRKKKDLTSDQRKQIISELLLSAEMVGNEIKLTRGALAATAKNFDRDLTTISRIWKILFPQKRLMQTFLPYKVVLKKLCW